MRKSEARELVVSLVAVLGSAAVVATCSASRPGQSPSLPVASGSTAVASASSPRNVAVPDPEQGGSEPELAPLPRGVRRDGPPADRYGVSPEGNPVPRLPAFFSSLEQLRVGNAGKHVRIMWLGDSHTQADFWTHEVRRELQQRFGNGGPGFVHIGWPHDRYRHEGVRIQSRGDFSIVPNKLVSQEPVADGVFGLGGVRMTPKSGDATASLEVSPEFLPSKATWDLAYRFTDSKASMRVSVPGQNPVSISASEADAGAPGQIRHVLLNSGGPGGRIEVGPFTGWPELLGVVIESERPGVVLDTLGLNGARYTTALAYDEATWVSEVTRRAPELIVAAFGTNESSNTKFKPEAHKRMVMNLISRAKKASPSSDCLIFGPVDRGGADYSDAIERLNEVQRQAAAELGCAFWDGQKAMGGKLAMEDWVRAKPSLAASDRVHLSRNGYVKIGSMLARDILRGYSVWAGRAEADGLAEVTAPGASDAGTAPVAR